MSTHANPSKTVDVTPEVELPWTLTDAVALCTAIHNLPSEKFHCHPALTGGLLYKTGRRKDCDIVIYQRGDVNGERLPIDWPGLWMALDAIGLHLIHDFGYVKKCEFFGLVVDVFDPTQDGGNYGQQDDKKLDVEVIV